MLTSAKTEQVGKKKRQIEEILIQMQRLVGA